MYEVHIFDEDAEDFRPFRSELGNKVAFPVWGDAAAMAAELNVKYPGNQFRVWYVPDKARAKRATRFPVERRKFQDEQEDASA